VRVFRFPLIVAAILALTVSPLAFARHRAAGSTPAHQFEGLITAAAATSITVHDSHGDDVTFTVSDKTSITKGNQPVPVANLQVGWRVHVAANQSDKTWTADRVIVQDENKQTEQVEVSGKVTAVGTSSLTVSTTNGDMTVNVDSNTVIREKGQVIQLSAVNVGDQVEAVGTSVDAHTILAQRINVEVPETEAGEVEVQGTVQTVGTSSLTVSTSNGTMTVNVDSNTVIRKQGTTIQLSDVKVGDKIEAVGTSIDPTTILAKTINVESPETETEDVEVEGTVKAVGTSSLTVTTSKGDETVNVDSKTVITKDDTKIQLSDINVGDKVQAEGTKVDATTMLAKKIEVGD